MELDEKMIKAYLLRTIADANMKISQVFYYDAQNNGKQDGVGRGMESISDFFTEGRFSVGMRDVVEYKEKHPNSSYATYHFFDLPTLVSYSIYVNMIVDKMYDYKMQERRRYVNKNDVIRAQKDTIRYFLDNKNTRLTGGFNPKKTFGTEKKYKQGRLVLAPQKPLSWKEFDKKYTVEDAQKQLSLYLKEMFDNSKSEKDNTQSNSESLERMDLFSGDYERISGTEDIASIIEKENMSQKPEVIKHAKTVSKQEKPETFTYYYKKRKFVLRVVNKEYYTDIDGYGLTSIEAVGDNCRLMGTFYSSGEAYKGNLYDLDGNFVNIDDGVMFFHKWSNPVSGAVADDCDEMDF